MTLLGTFVDVTTVGSIAAQGTATFAHGLPSSPDFCIPMHVHTASAATVAAFAFTFDATNVTVANIGTGASTSGSKVVSIYAHSVIR